MSDESTRRSRVETTGPRSANEDVSATRPKATPPESTEASFDGVNETRSVVRPTPSPTPQARPSVGDHAGVDGRFELTEELGSGSMGVVFRAWDSTLRRDTAIKFVLHRPELDWEGAIGLLHREAITTARLSHENIVQVFDLAVWNGVPLVVMEYVDGVSLTKRLRESRLDLREALRLTKLIASGLAHAHGHGIVHRDLKPANVVVHAGGLKILDFGLARPTSRGPTGTPDPELSGTPLYMAPEQWRGEPQDAGADMWAVGVILFEMLTGRHPFAEANALRQNVLSGEPAPSVRRYRKDLPESLEDILHALLEKEPRRRLSSARDLIDALTGVERLLPWSGVLSQAGVAAGQAPGHAERRQVTLVACSFRAEHEGPSAQDLDDLSELSVAFRAHAVPIVQAHGGTIVSSARGRLLACFGFPAAEDDTAEGAVEAARLLARESSSRFGSSDRVAIRTAVHTDTVIVTLADGPLGGVPTIEGDAPDVAAALANDAPPGSVVLSPSTHALVRRAFVTERIDRGSGAEPTFRVLGESDYVSRFERAQAAGLGPLVGRQRELETLAAAWAAASAGVTQFVLVAGEAGIGKSRIVQALTSRLGAHAATIMTCQCWPRAEASALHPVIELVVRRLHTDASDDAAARLAKLEAFLGSLGLPLEDAVPGIASLLSIPLSSAYAAPKLAPAIERQRCLETVLTVLARTYEQKPVLLVFEDLHWVDASTLELLALLRQRVRNAALMVLMTARPEFDSTLLPESTQTLSVERLSLEETTSLVQAVAGHTLAVDLVSELVAKTEGVPLFVEEFTRAVLEAIANGPASAQGDARKLVAPIPATLQELVFARLDRLAPTEKKLAQLGAVVGRTFGRDLMLAMADLPEALIDRRLGRLVDIGILSQRRKDAGSVYQFRHSLVQEAAYGSLLKNARREWHRKAAELLAATSPHVADTSPEVIAHHYAESGAFEASVRYWTMAGEIATKGSANVEAIAHFTNALRVLDQVPPSASTVQNELRIQLALGTALSAVKGYAAVEVERTFARAHDLCRQLGEAPQLSPALLGLWLYYFARAEFPVAYELGCQLTALGENDEAIAMLGHRTCGTTLFVQGKIDDAFDRFGQAIAPCGLARHKALAVAHGLAPGVAAHSYLAWIGWLQGHPSAAVHHSAEALRTGVELAHPHTEAFAQSYAATFHQIRLEPEKCVELAQTGIDIAAEHGFSLWNAWSTALHGWGRAMIEGSSEGLAELREGIASWQSTGCLTALSYFFAIEAEVCLKLGRLDGAQTAIERALTFMKQHDEHNYESEIYRLRGAILRVSAPERARDAFGIALATARRQRLRLFELRAAIALAALDGPRAAATGSLELLRSVAGTFSEPGVPELTHAADLLRGHPLPA